MSNGHRLELLADGCGGAYLNFWDSLHGEDRCFHITQNLKVTVSQEGEDVDVNDIRASLLGLLYRLDSVETMNEAEFTDYMGIDRGSDEHQDNV